MFFSMFFYGFKVMFFLVLRTSGDFYFGPYWMIFYFLGGFLSNSKTKDQVVIFLLR